MPIRPIKPPVPEGGEPAAPTPRAKIASPPPRRRPSRPPSPVTPEAAARSGKSASQQRATHGKDPREQKATKQKRQPTGDYEVGFAKTPIGSRFQVGNKGGPGRPNGLKSQDTYLRKELNERRTLRVNGVERKISNRELATKLLVEIALKKQDIKHLELIVAHGRRLFPDAAPVGDYDAALPDSAFDEAILRQLFAGLSMGEPDPNCPNPWADLIDQVPNARDAGSILDDKDGTAEDGVATDGDPADSDWDADHDEQ